MRKRLERGSYMRYINTLREGETIRNIYLCKGKRSAETRNGKMRKKVENTATHKVFL